MAIMLTDRDSSDRRLDATRRHIRLCKQMPGAEALATAIETVYNTLLEKQAETKSKHQARQDALDDFILSDAILDDQVRTAFERCKQHDRENPGTPVLMRLFPDGERLFPQLGSRSTADVPQEAPAA